MIEIEQDPIICLECDAEFGVQAFTDEGPVAFCPFCGAEVEGEDIFEEDLFDDEDEPTKFS
jgi:hypothetical protein